MADACALSPPIDTFMKYEIVPNYDMQKMKESIYEDGRMPNLPKGLRGLGLLAYFKYKCWRADVAHVLDTEFYPCSRRPNSPEHVLIVVIDALRPDYRPRIDMEFTTAITPAPWTFPAVTSINTGRYPHEHQAVAHTRADDDTYAMPAQATPDRHLPGAFESMGYATGCFSGFMMPLLAVYGWYQRHRTFQHGRAEKVIDAYRKWRQQKDKTFAYVHLSDLHEPLSPPPEYETEVDMSIPNLRTWDYTDDFDCSIDCERYRTERLKLYEGCLEYVSDCLNPLIEQLRNDTVVVVTADHGEAHWEHYQLDRKLTDSRPNYGVGHGGTPFDAVARVPVGVQVPEGDPPMPDPGWGTLRDIPVTVHRIVSEDQTFKGQEWQDPIPRDRWVLCEGARYGVERKAVYRDDAKVIRSKKDGVNLFAKVYRDTESAGERFIDNPSDEMLELGNIMDSVWREEDATQDVGRIVQNQLEALGYK